MQTELIIQKSLEEANTATSLFCSNPYTLSSLLKAANLMADSLRSGGKILSCGNGGSSCDAMHFAEELTGRFRQNRQPLAAIAISDPAHLTCVANDFGYTEVFSRYVKALAKPRDILLAISTSGNSLNVLNAAKEAKSIGMSVIVLCGHNETELTLLADVAIHTPKFDYSDRIQELHIKCIHIMIEAIENIIDI